MNTMTIHADDVYAMALRAYAEKIGKSISQTVQILTAPKLGLARDFKEEENPFMELCGVLPKGSAAGMAAKLAQHRSVDAEMWRCGNEGIADCRFECADCVV